MDKEFQNKINNDKKVDLHASGRTDKGVHAFGQVINYHTNIFIE